MKLKKALMWGTGIAGVFLIVDNMRIKKWITLPIWATNLSIPILKGNYDFKMDRSKIKITGKPGEYQMEFPPLEIIKKVPKPYVIATKSFLPWKLPTEIKSYLSLVRIYWALNKIKVTTTEDDVFIWLHINIPKDIKVPIYW